jgi:hypothetical protein
MNRRIITVVAVLLPLLCGARPAGADCFDPVLSAGSQTVTPGARLRFIGKGFFSFCDCIAPRRSPEPAANVKIVFIQGDRRNLLDSADADSHFEFARDVIIPLDATPGAALVRAEIDNPFRPGASIPLVIVDPQPWDVALLTVASALSVAAYLWWSERRRSVPDATTASAKLRPETEP